jgi:hypothetical protein
MKIKKILGITLMHFVNSAQLEKYALLMGYLEKSGAFGVVFIEKVEKFQESLINIRASKTGQLPGKP